MGVRVVSMISLLTFAMYKCAGVYVRECLSACLSAYSDARRVLRAERYKLTNDRSLVRSLANCLSSALV